jgi:1,4-dihydroxy-2-naphthoyl-CoA hydrolase
MPRPASEVRFPEWLGIEVLEVSPESASARLAIESRHRAPNGYLHAAVVVGLADTACGYGCVAALPDGAVGFTTIELKTNFISTVRGGALRCVAGLVHGGGTTQVWDARVSDEDTGRTAALFRATQLVLYRRP